MDIVDFWQKFTDAYNEACKCDFCWFFGAPLTNEGANQQQTPEDAACCVHVILSNMGKNTVRAYNPLTGLLTSHLDDYTFRLQVVKKDDVGTNVYNEIKDHPIEEGKWQKILYPLQKCLCAENELEAAFCEILGYQIRITNWRMTLLKNYNDGNFTGWEINGTFRHQIV